MPVMGFALNRLAFLMESASHSGVSVRGFSGPTNSKKKKEETLTTSITNARVFSSTGLEDTTTCIDTKKQ